MDQRGWLGILGGSAGGFWSAARSLRLPTFRRRRARGWRADMVRAEVTPNGCPTFPIWHADNEAGFVHAGDEYLSPDRRRQEVPRVLLTHGVHDPRVEVWHSTKTAARLMAAQAGLPGGRSPVLLRLDFDAGHGVGSTKTQQLQERADVFTFFLWQMGVEGYQPMTAAK